MSTAQPTTQTSEKTVIGPVEREFLPAALEITLTPPSPLGRMMTWTICAFGLLGLAWASWGHIDIVAVSAGKIVTQARTQVIQAPEAGIVKSILVEPGQRVRQGETIIMLDTSAIQAEIDHAREDLVQARLDEVRLRSFIDPSQSDAYVGIADIGPAEIERSRLQLVAQRLERQSRVSAIDREVEMRRSELEMSQLLFNKAQDVLPLIEERASIRSNAAKIEFGSKLLNLEAQQQVIEMTAEMAIQRQKIASGASTIGALAHQKQQVEAEFLKTAYNDLARALTQKSAAIENLGKAKRRLELSTIKSPVDGIVTQLSIRTLGGVLSPSQQLVSITPDGSPLEVEVVLPNREAGFVTKDMDVEVKVDAFPFTRYGLLKGHVISVAQDAEPQANPNESTAFGSQRKADQSLNIEGSERLLYTVRISIEPGTLKLDGKPAPLMPGMSVRAEIKTGSRSILEFLIAPLAEYMSQSMKER